MSSITSGYCWHKTFFSNEHIWWTGVIIFFCDFYSYGWLLSLFKDYLYSMKFNMGNWICCWICMYSTSLTVISVPVPVVHPFSYRACKTFWFPIHMNYINHACTLIDSIHFVFQYQKPLNVRYLPDNFEHYTRRFRRKVHIFGDDSIGHCEGKCSYQREYKSEWLSSWSYLNSQIQKHCAW